jgi:hypothetical protein
VIETAKEAGHSVYVLTNTYLNLVVKAKGDAFFAFTPEACGIDNWPELVARHIELAGECHEREKRSRKTGKSGSIPDAPASVSEPAPER